MSNAEAAFQRSKVYKIFSHIFAYPEEELFEFIKGGEFLGEIKDALERMLIPAKTILNLTCEVEKQCKSTDFVAIQDEYSRLFETPTERRLLHEASYMDFPQEEMADIAGFYRAFGMEFVDERPDHIAMELEFMHLVTMKEAEASVKGETEKVEICISVEKKFLGDHLGRWVDAFSKALAKEKGLFYTPIASLLVLWVDLECRYLKVSPLKVADFKIRDIKEENHICERRFV